MSFKFILGQFGLAALKPKPFTAPQDSISAGDLPPFEGQQYEAPDYVAVSWMGTPVIDNLVLRLDDLEIQFNEVMLTVSMTKNIVKTFVNGRAGSIKEYINDGDYSVSIVGGIYSQNQKYPVDDVKTFVELMKAAEAIKVTSKFLKYFSIHQIVVESYEVPQSKGFTNVQPFSITALSDEPIELLIDVASGQ